MGANSKRAEVKIQNITIIFIIAVVALQAVFYSNRIDVLEEQLETLLPKIGLIDARFKQAESTEERATNAINKLLQVEQKKTALRGDPTYVRYRQRVSTFLQSNINRIVQRKTFGGRVLHVTEIEFISPGFVLVDFDDGHFLSTSLLSVLETEDGLTFTELSSTTEK